MTDQPERKKAKCLCVDIETSRQDSLVLREIGVFRPDTGEEMRISSKSADLRAKLDKISEGAAFVLGHNIIDFDQPALAILHPDLALHRLPLVDTLELSPLAFPQNPYHHLVKDYKLCSTTRNNPVRDAELAYQLFLDQDQALRQRQLEHPDEVLCLHYLLTAENGKGIANFLATVRGALRPPLTDTQAAWLRLTDGKICRTGQRQVADHYLSNPDWQKPLAYVLAWLRVAGGNSVLPPWVGLKFPKTRELIALLRDIPCNHADCGWCREQHDLSILLPRYFPGINQFRPAPATDDGKSMQQCLVENAFAGLPTLAILPTGGGKSLCYQLPALARFYRNGGLTVIVSPLQSLMKDQVDGLETRGITCAGYLNGLLNPLERRMMLDKLRLGDLGLIYVAPEQFRNVAFTGALTHRDIAAWVFDEAHCLSKWGHDFRPDYLYVSRFIKIRQQEQPSPVFCFTATAKPDVVADIRDHFRKQLGIALQTLIGGVSRENLLYEVHATPAQAKFPEVLRLVEETLQGEGGAIVFCARQKTVEEMALFLKNAGLDCGYFHGGMLPAEKRRIQEAFITGELRVIAATNAFGMGVDKADVRLVVHLDTPGSLENYLQEAGRAGRDREPARCVLLYDDADLDVQFRLLRNSRLSQHDIHAILQALRSIERKDRAEGSVVVTSGEILLEIPDKQGIDPDAADADTKVRIAVSWLEEARLLERQENHTRVFPGSLLVTGLDEARALLKKKLGANIDIQPYIALLAELFSRDGDEGVSTDELMLATGRDSRQVRQMLRELDQLNILSNDIEIGVMLYRDPDSAERLEDLRKLEDALLASLRESAPDADREEWQILDMRRLCDTLRRDVSATLDPGKLSRLMKSFAEAFGGDPGQRAFFALRPGGQDYRYLKLLRNWQEIEIIHQKRMRLAYALMNFFIVGRQGNNLLVTCKQHDLEAALQNDLTLQDLDVRDWQTALAAVLLYLDSNEVWHLARGKAVFRTAMSIQLNPEARRRQFKKTDYAELALHYKDKIIQVHVMAEYARLALDKIQAAMTFIVDYFCMDRDKFIRGYFAGREQILEMATTESAHRLILTDLQNPEQQSIVAAPIAGGHLVLAGPGSGKTKVLVHRVAWLLRECLALPEDIMILSYNRSAVYEIRRRLWALAGADAAGVTVQTLHGLAMRLTGTSYAVAAERGETIDFSAVIKTATSQLKNAELGDDLKLSLNRQRLLSGLRYLLIDEYQDINAEHYEFISALAGRALNSDEDKLSILAVGDDDQNIYAFGGSNVRFIKQFADDYQAKTYYLLENYRSSGYIIHCANRVIAPIRERMKARQTIRVNHHRRQAPDGGEFAGLDSVCKGRVHIIETPPHDHAETKLALDELLRLNLLENSGQISHWGRYAVIARHWETLEPLAALCRQHAIPARLLRDENLLDLHTTREGYALLSLLNNQRRSLIKPRQILRFGALSRWFQRRYRQKTDDVIEHPYRALLAQFILQIELSAPGCQHIIANVIEALYDFRHGNQSGQSENRHAPLLLLTAHRAKGLEFDHVLILDGAGWRQASDEERRLFYVAMTRARKTLTVCARRNSPHVFLRDFADLCLKTEPVCTPEPQPFKQRTWIANQTHVWLDWPGYFGPRDARRRAIAELEVGDELQLRPRPDEQGGWELWNKHGLAVTRMARCFAPPRGEILSVTVAAMLYRHKKPGDSESFKCSHWEVVLPEITYLPKPP